ncbi:biorientation of chromosomes in cell division protein 1-like 1 isoform X2 [Adelges cooleyi]|uniref:biorientation of chromosomes in cell division protein 1-like 1 isoform X2 n=1 Tax=Adelges cooleyi TaxID=133065 RepID=UPI00217F4186|nr:biorientation of chromosomes in cell division protein 1-like 1 isoform X2 [Adelges cooleyi]
MEDTNEQNLHAMPQELDHIMITTEDIVCTILELLKSNGTFDELRRDCVSEIITKKRFQTLARLTETIAAKYLSTLKYTPELNKNTIREELKQYMFEGYESHEISNESNKILNQVFETSVVRNFETKIKFIVNECLGIPNDDTTEEMNGIVSGINVNNLVNIITDSSDSDHNRVLGCDINDEAEIDSPEFEPLFSSLYNDDSYNGDISGTSGTSGTVTSTVDLKSKHSDEVNSNCLESERQKPVDESNKFDETSNEQQSENNRPSCHMDHEKTHLIVINDTLMATKEELHKTTNSNQSDDVVSSRQKSTCSRIQKSLTTKIPQSIKKNYRNKDNMDEVLDHLMKNSKNFKSKKNKTRILKKHDKMSTSAKKTDSKTYDYRSSSFSNDDQEAAEVLIAMGSISCEVFNNDKTETEYRLTGNSDNKNITQNGDKQSEISDKSKHVGKTVKNKDKLDATFNQIFRKEHLINNNNSTNDIHLEQKDKSVALDNIKICDNNEPADRLSDSQQKQTFEKKKYVVDSTTSSVSKNELVPSNFKIKKDIKKTITEQDEKTVVTEKQKFKHTLKKKNHLNCDTTIDAKKTDNEPSKYTVRLFSESALDRPSTSRYSDPILKSKAGELYWGKRNFNTNEDSKVEKSKSFDIYNCKNDILSECTIIKHEALTESKNVSINHTNTKMLTNDIYKNPKTSGNPSLNSFTGFNNSEVEPCKYKLGVIASLVVNPSEFIGFSPTSAITCKNRDKVYAELVKLKNEKEEFSGFSEQEVQVCSGYEHVKQHLDLTEKEISSLAINQDQAIDGGNKTQSSQAIVNVENDNIDDTQANKTQNSQATVNVESDNIDDTQANKTQNSQATVNVESDNIDDTQANNQPTTSGFTDNTKVNNSENTSDSSQWIAKQILKYKLSPTWVKLERLADLKITVTKHHPDSQKAGRKRRVHKKKKPKTKKRKVIISSDED